ncbi:MAG: cupin domain-containing protein [Polyangiaceae bacterium]
MGRIAALFKADRAETAFRYSVSEWWLEPCSTGPGAHSHSEDDLFFVFEGTMTFFAGGEWLEAPAGSFVLIPGGTKHDFQNRGSVRAGALNFSSGVFEQEMEGIAGWFEQHPPPDAPPAGGIRVLGGEGKSWNMPVRDRAR